MNALLRRYRVALAFCAASLALLALAPETGSRALSITADNALEMLSFLPPVFVLLGLLDAWVDRETMMKFLGVDSGRRGNILAFLLGSAAAGPLYVAFPMAVAMMKKGASMFNVFIFVGAWSTTKVPLLLFESATLGIRFTAMRLAFNIAGIIAIAKILDVRMRARGGKT